MSLSLLLSAFFVSVGTLTATTNVPFYTVQTVDGDFPGETFGYGLNDLGDVVGKAQMPGESGWPFVFRDGVFTVLGAETGIGQSGSGEAISNSGLIAGTYYDPAMADPPPPPNGYVNWHNGKGVFFLEGNLLLRPSVFKSYHGQVGGFFSFDIYGFGTDTKLYGKFVRGSFSLFTYSYEYATQTGSMESVWPRTGTFSFNGATVEYTGSHGRSSTSEELSVNGAHYYLQDLVDPAADFTLDYRIQINAVGQICATGTGPDGRHRALLLSPSVWPAEVPPPVPIATPTPDPTPVPTPSYQLLNGRLNGVFRTATGHFVIAGKCRQGDIVKARWNGRVGQTTVRPNGNWRIRVSGLHRGKTRITVVAIDRVSGKHSRTGSVVVNRR